MAITQKVFEDYFADVQKKLPASKAWHELDLSHNPPTERVKLLHDAAVLELAFVTADFFGGAILSEDRRSARTAKVMMKQQITRAYHKAGLASTPEAASQLFSDACDQMSSLWGVHMSNAPSF